MKLLNVAAGMFVLLLSAWVWAGEDAASSLVLHLKLDEGAGKAAKDSSGKGNDGALKGTCRWADGKVGKALEFDGKGAYMDIMLMSPIDFDKSFTIVAWVKLKPPVNTLHHALITNLRDSDERKGFAIFEEPSDRRINVYRTPADKTDKSNYETRIPGFFEIDKWVHMAVVVNFDVNIVQDRILVLKNGGDAGVPYPAEAADASKNKWNNADLLRLGAEGVGTKIPYFFSGVIDELRIYQKALSEAEVRKLYDSENK